MKQRRSHSKLQKAFYACIATTDFLSDERADTMHASYICLNLQPYA